MLFFSLPFDDEFEDFLFLRVDDVSWLIDALVVAKLVSVDNSLFILSLFLIKLVNFFYSN